MVVGFIAAADLSLASAASIVYSWSGSLRLFDSSSADPWGIGADGADFILETAVDVGAIDAIPTQIAFAEFMASTARLWIDGNEASFVGEARIDFVDTENDFDFITMGGNFTKNGQTLTIRSVVTLTPSAFDFASPSETPPQFSGTATVASSEDLRQPYVATVPSNSAVTVIPEPHTLGLFASLALVAACGRRTL